MMLTTQFRIHEAPSVACATCGAPLPVDPTAAHVWCPSCRYWQAVPHELQRQAYEHLRATEQLGAERAASARQAEAHRVAAQRGRVSGGVLLFQVGFMLLSGLFGVGIYAFVGAIGLFESLSEELEPWAVAAVFVVLVVAALLVLGVLVGGSWAFYRLWTRHKRLAKRERSAEWFSAAHGSAGAMCGECGGPVAFQVGETAVTCGFCRSVVVATAQHAERLIRVALGQAQLARLEQAKAERQNIQVELTAKRRYQAYMAYAFAGSMALAALPVLLALYVWRTLTPSVEEAMLQLSRRLSGDFGAGIDLPFAWLDAYWIGETPQPLRETGPFQSRWSIEAVFHDRPVMVSCTTSWSDLEATQVVLLLARPRDRSRLNLESTPAAARSRARGFSLISDYAGIALVGRKLSHRQLDELLLTELAQAGYELAEQRS